MYYCNFWLKLLGMRIGSNGGQRDEEMDLFDYNLLNILEIKK